MPIIKKANLLGKILSFGRKSVGKTGFLGFYDETPGRRFAILLHSSDDAQTHRIAAQLDVRGVPIITKANLLGKLLSFVRKTVEKTGFFGVFR